MDEKKHSRVCVVGGGLSGLAAAYLIREKAGEDGVPVEVTLLEADPVPGGKIGTIAEEGYIMQTWHLSGACKSALHSVFCR